MADSLPAEPQGKPKNTEVGSLSFLQWIFPTQELNWGLLYCRRILLPTKLLGKPIYILGLAYLFLEKKKKLSGILIGIALTILSVTDQLEKNCHLKTSSLPIYEHVVSIYFMFFAILHICILMINLCRCLQFQSDSAMFNFPSPILYLYLPLSP